jgi:hypothetical protein
MTDMDETNHNDPSQQALQAGKDSEQAEEQAPTPFDHPLFLPVLLSGLTLWFGYDGWINQDPDMLEHLTFNRVGAGVLFAGAVYYGIGGYREWKEDQEKQK